MENIEEYKSFLMNECLTSANANETTPDEEFIEYVLELFEQNEESLCLQKAYFEMQGPKNRKIQIDGWGL